MFDLRRREVPAWVLAVDGPGHVVGLAATGELRRDVARLLGLATARRSGFDGFQRGGGPGPAALYGWLGSDRWCRVTLGP